MAFSEDIGRVIAFGEWLTEPTSHSVLVDFQAASKECSDAFSTAIDSLAIYRDSIIDEYETYKEKAILSGWGCKVDVSPDLLKDELWIASEKLSSALSGSWEALLAIDCLCKDAYKACSKDDRKKAVDSVVAAFDILKNKWLPLVCERKETLDIAKDGFEGVLCVSTIDTLFSRLRV